jgi:hypothetical protein
MTVSRWTWAAAKCRGVSHQRANLRLQDAFKCAVGTGPSEPLILIVSDGAGTASYGGQGASVICRNMAASARRHFERTPSLPSSQDLESWLDSTRDHIVAIAARRQLSPRDFAATLVLVISDGAHSLTLHVGDGCAVLKQEESGHWIAPTWPEHGEYASTTSFVTDEPEARVRVASHVGQISGIAVFSDGLERLVLDLRDKQPYGPFFERMIAPVALSDARGRDHELSQKLRAFLDSDHVNNRTDDDKTLVLAVRHA